jgi:hypothetical protein
MARKSAKAMEFPAECCGVCSFAHPVEDGLECFGNPPVLYGQDMSSVTYVRSVSIEPTDHICHLFKPKCHS